MTSLNDEPELRTHSRRTGKTGEDDRRDGAVSNSADHVLVNLPFLHMVSMRRGTQRKPRNYMVRGYTDVAVPILSESDLIPTLEVRHLARPYGLDPYAVMITYTSWNGRLFTTFLLGDVPAVPATYEAKYSAGAHPYKRPATPFWRGSIPTPDIRNGYEPTLDPLYYPTHHELLIEMNGEGLSPDGSDRGIREVDARTHLEKSILLVDGVIHTEVPEPVWNVDRRYETVSLCRFPKISNADEHFRLDRFEPGRHDQEQHNRQHVTMLRPELLRRDDVRELARCGLQLWPKFGPRCARMGGDVGEESYLFRQVEAIVAAGVPTDPQQSIAVLDLYAEARRVAAQRGQRFWDKGYSVPHRAGAIATRWRFERDAYLAKHENQGLDAADLDALDATDLS